MIRKLFFSALWNPSLYCVRLKCKFVIVRSTTRFLFDFPRVYFYLVGQSPVSSLGRSSTIPRPGFTTGTSTTLHHLKRYIKLPSRLSVLNDYSVYSPLLHYFLSSYDSKVGLVHLLSPGERHYPLTTPPYQTLNHNL